MESAMRILTIFTSTVILCCSLVSLSFATIYTDPVEINEVLGGNGSTQSTASWSHTLPGGDFSVPPDTINSASLEITARRAADQNDIIVYLGDEYFDLGYLLATGNSEVTTEFNLVDLGVFYLDSTWGPLDTLAFRLDYTQDDGNNNTLTLVQSVFTLDYTSNPTLENPTVGDVAVVPEPSTFLLLGGGLAGLALVVRRRMKE
jgi:hypothetical protein